MSSPEIKKVVYEFYAVARQDILIGYHFARIADFDTHLPRIVKFWEGQLLGVHHQFSPPLDLINAHVPLKIHRGEVGRWVRLFEQTLERHLDDKSLRERWLDKIYHFEKIFLTSSQLFPKRPE
jgi:truncated hemoglobin YjbI